MALLIAKSQTRSTLTMIHNVAPCPVCACHIPCLLISLAVSCPESTDVPSRAAAALEASSVMPAPTTSVATLLSSATATGNPNTNMKARFITDAEWQIVCSIREHHLRTTAVMQEDIDRLQHEYASIKEECENLKTHHKKAIGLLMSL